MESPITDQPPATSLWARMANIIAAPGEVFDEVKRSKPSTANWLVPTLLAIVMGVIGVFVIFSQPAILQKMHEQQNKAIEDKVTSGKMTQAQADQAEAMMDKFGGSTFIEITSSFVVIVWVFARVFWWSLVLWLLGKWFLKASFPYQQALEVSGLACVILVLGGIVFPLLTVSLGRMAPVNLALLANPDDQKSALHFALTAVDLFDLWATAVMAAGLSRLAGVAYGRALTVTMIYWVVIAMLFGFTGWFFAKLSSGFK